MEKKEFLYEGKAKKIYATDDPDKVIVYYKDDATAGNGEKKGTIADKGIINNELTSYLFEMLASQGVKTHFIEKLNDREQLCWKLDIVPLEVITRNIIAGSMAKRLGLEEGTMPKKMIQEFSYKDDDLGDPLINSDHAVAIGAATEEEVAEILEVTAKINQILSDAFKKEGILLVDFKIEFGRDKDGNLLLADEITPDTCRLWDAETKKKLDKDRFRRDMGGIEEAYKEILHRITKK
ncbi:phosphoribosylaminoimidazolesuccinocarboxamide synthase [uncultured Varibaculum sp.]|uniref:phosphoribosylaminoimidazolesuccinocarboxamide synthase n=1 Tax=uncultured Varibaculum sp. TaxID=413896 RepID=UPI000C7DE8F0|nr:phosphoribosylaminoimidazolesuccinocarboxamide synthase [uncultured Varibaculum sp.]